MFGRGRKDLLPVTILSCALTYRCRIQKEYVGIEIVIETEVSGNSKSKLLSLKAKQPSPYKGNSVGQVRYFSVNDVYKILLNSNFFCKRILAAI